MFKRFFEKRKLRWEAIQKAREDFTSWFDISKSNGWKAYESYLNKEIENVKEQMFNNVSLNGEDLKRLQLVLQVWKKVLIIPRKLEDNAKSGGK